MKKNLLLSQVYQWLEPGPVVLVTTARKNEANVMTMSWLTMIDFEPPIVGIVMSDRNYSFELLKETKECVINIPTVEMLKKIVGIGNTSGKTVDKFEKFQLSTEPASQVLPPLLPECTVNLECKVIDTQMVSKYDLFILEVLKGWIRPSRKKPQMVHHSGKGNFIVDGKTIKVPSKKK